MSSVKIKKNFFSLKNIEVTVSALILWANRLGSSTYSADN